MITANQMKGLTFEVVFLCGLDHYFRNGSEDDLAYISHQKRLIYSCMGRARQLLYLLHHNKISPNFKGLRDFVDFYEFS